MSDDCWEQDNPGDAAWAPDGCGTTNLWTPSEASSSIACVAVACLMVACAPEAPTPWTVENTGYACLDPDLPPPFGPDRGFDNGFDEGFS